MSEIEIQILEEIKALNKRLSVLEQLLGEQLTQEQARKILGVSRNTIISYRKKGILKPRYEGKRIYYNINDLNRLLS